jgi:hypothetical protein
MGERDPVNFPDRLRLRPLHCRWQRPNHRFHPRSDERIAITKKGPEAGLTNQCFRAVSTSSPSNQANLVSQ